MSALDEDIIHPKRILIMTNLFLLREVTEGDLAKATGIDWGSLSTHLRRLESKGYIARRKAITSKGIRTVVAITEEGYRKYVEEIRKLLSVLDGVIG